MSHPDYACRFETNKITVSERIPDGASGCIYRYNNSFSFHFCTYPVSFRRLIDLII